MSAFSDDDLPDLRSILLLPPVAAMPTLQPANLRRSPRKTATSNAMENQKSMVIEATSRQRQSDRGNKSPSKAKQQQQQYHAPVKLSRAQVMAHPSLGEVPVLLQASTAPTLGEGASAANRQSPRRRNPVETSLKLTHVDSLLLPLSEMAVGGEKTGEEECDDSFQTRRSQSTQVRGMRNLHPTSAMSRITQAAKKGTETRQSPRKNRPAPSYASRYVLGEARCDDLNESSGAEEDEDEDTDLSGFIVDDNAELSIEEEDEEQSSQEEDRRRRRRRNAKVEIPVPRRGLQRGSRRKVVVESGDEGEQGNELADILGNLDLGGQKLRQLGEQEKTRHIDVVDLTSSPPPQQQNPGCQQDQYNDTRESLANMHIPGPSRLFDGLKSSLRLSPPRSSKSTTIPHKSELGDIDFGHQEKDDIISNTEDRLFTTPPATPPRSPSKLKSPSKLLSPSKRVNVGEHRTVHRQSMDAFWDHNMVNEWTDQNSTKKAPAASPRKNPLARFQIWSDDDEFGDEMESGINESSDSLPSPCESPRKNRSSPMKSPEKAEKKRLADERKAKAARKKDFESRREQMATELLQALDQNVTKSQISKMSASTGGVQIIWSKTLRSTAGRANWRRTVTKNGDSPIKDLAIEAPGTKVSHFANIELAVKVIDRPDRLVNTLAHEFCHLANFMVSGVRDQPHGESFKGWAAKVTSWMKQQTAHPEWNAVEVTTKHGYVIEHKYLWVCVGRDQSMAMKFLNIDDEQGCGAEYGRHSKSIDVDKHRCGRCQGRLVQVRPTPRTGGVSPKKKLGTNGSKGDRMSLLEKMIAVVELSD